MVGVAVLLLATSTGRPDSAHSATASNRAATVAPSIYVAQTVSGSGNGSSCANANSAAFFNTVSNWGTGKPIGPGKTVGLCGTIMSTLTAQGSGMRSKPVTIQFTAGAKISQPVCSPCLDLDNRSYITVDGGTNGVIEATDNGTNLGHHSNSTGLHADSCDNCEVKNLTIRNIYVHDGRGNNVEIDQTQVRSIWANGSSIRIHHNVLHDAGWSIFVSMRNGQHHIRVYNNDIYNVDHGLVTSSGAAGGSFGPIWFNNNHIHDLANWDTTSNAYHHDGIHCYTVAGGSPMHIGNFYIYNNRFDGNIGRNATAWVFLEGGSGAGRTPCADSTSNIWVFNNVGIATATLNNGVWAPTTGRAHLFHNTAIGISSTAGVGMQTSSSNLGTSEIKNNIFSGFGQFLGVDPAYYSGSNVDYNVYASGNGSGNGWYCNGFKPTFARWKACVGGDSHGRFVADAQLNAAGIPRARSPVLGAGTNLTSLCTGNLTPLCFDIDGALRPFRMKPDIGAYQGETAAIAPRAVGRARIGASKASIEQFYGRRRAMRSKRPLFGAFDIRDTLTATYHLHGGLFKVSYLQGRAIAVSTTSRYYSTRAGFGVGARADQTKLARNGWRPCRRQFTKRRAGIATTIHVSHGVIAAFALSRSANLHCL